MIVFLCLIMLFIGGYIGWLIRDNIAAQAESDTWWATRKHIDGITCPPQTKCIICRSASIP